jgi:hypothetical protein
MRVQRDFQSKSLSLDQRLSIAQYLDDIDAHSVKPCSTPMDPQWKYGDDPPITDRKMHKLFRSQVGSVSYFAQCTRPDIAYAVNCLCRHLDNPNSACFRALKHLNAYLVGTPDLGLVFHSPDPSALRLEAYADSSYGGTDTDSGKSHTGYVVYFGGAPVDWSSHLQSVIAQSSAEAEQISAFSSACVIFNFRQFLEEFTLHQTGATVIWEDNEACIAQSKNPVNHKRCKHILLKYHYLRDLTESGIVRLEYICTTDQVADILTKPLALALFSKLRPFLVRSCASLSSSSSS